MNQVKKFWLFTIIVLFFSLILWGSLAIFKFRVPNLESSSEIQVLPMIIYIINGFIPSILGLILYKATEKKTWKENLLTIIPKKKDVKTYIEILVIFLIMIIAQFMFYHWFVDSFDFTIVITQASQLLPLIILGPLSEEIGWRGYLEKQADGYISKPYKPFVIGSIWALWHLPLFFILGTTQQVNQMSFLTFSVMVILVSVIMSYYREKTNNSIFTAIFIHYIYAVGLTYYILGGSYSILSDLLSIFPFLLVACYLYFKMNKKTLYN